MMVFSFNTTLWRRRLLYETFYILFPLMSSAIIRLHMLKKLTLQGGRDYSVE